MTAAKNLLQRPTYLATLAVCASAVLFDAGCTKISLSSNPSPTPAKPAPAGQVSPAPATNASAHGPLTGDWQFGFMFNGSALQSSVHLEQNGNNLKGTGKDDQTGMEFVVENGVLAPGANNTFTVHFVKKYTTGKSPPVTYEGTLEQVSANDYKGPYMKGTYITGKAGQEVTNEWEAQMNNPPAPEQAAQPVPQPMPQPTRPALLSDKPELSGKWNCGYEYNFRNIHSTMFLEQDGTRISGHGVDHETHEKFGVEKGQYHHPSIVFTRTYPASKQTIGDGPKKHTVSFPKRTMIFRGKVSVVNETDYQGPYLRGKTQGGGDWEAQLYK